MQTGRHRTIDYARCGVLLCWILFLCSCQPPETPSDELPDGIRSASFRGIFAEAMKLTDGSFVGQPFVPGAASRPEAHLMQSPWLLTDVNGDDTPEYVVVLTASSGGSGTFSYLAVLAEQGGGFANLATALIGDRVDVSALNFMDGQIVARVSEFSAGVHLPATQRSWRLSDGTLAEIVELAGELVLGHEVREIDPCGEAVPMWVLDSTGGELAARLESFALPPYEPVFVVVRAIVSDAPDAEFAKPYAEQAEVLHLLRMESEGFGCRLDLDDAGVRALGVEPFWRLDVKNDVLELRVPDAPPRYFRRRSEPETFQPVQGVDEDGVELMLMLQQQSCTDPMSGALYQYSADLSIGPRRLIGCALTPLPGQ